MVEVVVDGVRDLLGLVLAALALILAVVVDGKKAEIVNKSVIVVLSTIYCHSFSL